jgi:hypothetical protein
MLRSVVRCYSFIGSQAHGHLPRNREAWNADLEECDVSGANLPRYIGYYIKFDVDVAVQRYTEIIDVINLCVRKVKPSTQYNAPKSSANSVIFGGMIVPATTAPMPMAAWTSASTSREADALVFEIPDFVGHVMFVWNRFVSPEKSTLVRFNDADLLNAPLAASFRAAKAKQTRGKMGVSTLPGANEAQRTTPHGPFSPLVIKLRRWISLRELESDRASR